MRRVAGLAAFRLHGCMLESKRPGLVGVTLEADLVLRRRGAQLLAQEAAMLVVAVGALHQALLDAMAERPGEILLGLGMATEAKLRLPLGQQVLRFPGMVSRVARDAAHAVDVVLGALEVGVLLAKLMARQTALAGLLRRRAGEGEYLRLVAAALQVSPARTMASLATLHSAFMALQGCLPVRRCLELLVDLFMAGLAGVRPEVRRALNRQRITSPFFFFVCPSRIGQKHSARNR